MCKFIHQEDESKAHSADFSKACSNLKLSTAIVFWIDVHFNESLRSAATVFTTYWSAFSQQLKLDTQFKYNIEISTILVMPQPVVKINVYWTRIAETLKRRNGVELVSIFSEVRVPRASLKIQALLSDGGGQDFSFIKTNVFVGQVGVGLVGVYLAIRRVC